MCSEARSRPRDMDTVAKAKPCRGFRLVHAVEAAVGSQPVPERRLPVSVSITKHKNFVGGEWVDSATGETMEVLNPATGEAIEIGRAHV